MADVLMAATVVTTGLVAGLFAAFAYAVLPGLRRVEDGVAVQTMRAINRAILNPVFALIFFGALGLGIAATVTTHGGNGFAWAATALVLYVATMIVTIVRNVPLNEALERGTSTASDLRVAFETPWTGWNLVRTVTSIASTVCWVAALAHA